MLSLFVQDLAIHVEDELHDPLLVTHGGSDSLLASTIKAGDVLPDGLENVFASYSILGLKMCERFKIVVFLEVGQFVPVFVFLVGESFISALVRATNISFKVFLLILVLVIGASVVVVGHTLEVAENVFFTRTLTLGPGMRFYLTDRVALVSIGVKHADDQVEEVIRTFKSALLHGGSRITDELLVMSVGALPEGVVGEHHGVEDLAESKDVDFGSIVALLLTGGI